MYNFLFYVLVKNEFTLRTFKSCVSKYYMKVWNNKTQLEMTMEILTRRRWETEALRGKWLN